MGSLQRNSKFCLEGIFDQIRQIVGTADGASKKLIMSQLRDMAYSLEDADDTVNRIGHQPLQLAVTRVGIDLKLFDLLCASSEPLSVNEITKTTGGSPQLIGRLMRFLASIAVIKEAGRDTFTATNVTRNLAIPASQAGLCHSFETTAPQYQQLPAFLKKLRYQAPMDPAHTVFQDAFNFEGLSFEWFCSHPENSVYFQEFMGGRRQSLQETWLSVYPIETETKALDPKSPLLVDIGGSIGHVCAQFKQVFPNAPGRVIVQDLPETIAAALPTPGVENMAYNFFEIQPVKDAKFYYLAHVLHDWPDYKCREILRNTKAAMGKDSVLLVDEMVLPDIGVHSHVTSIDIEMMCAFASQERTQSQWDELFALEGFKRLRTWVYKPSHYESVMKVVPV